jgi:hypothetical protein
LLEAQAREAECFVFEGRHAEAISLLSKGPTAERTAAVAIIAERALGYALHQARRPEEGREHLEESVRLAREVGSEYEVALSLRALAQTRHADADVLAEAESTLERLGVVSLRAVPLP